MGNKIPYYNDTNKYQHIGPIRVPPHESREVDESHLPGYEPPVIEASEPSAEEVLAKILAHTVKQIEDMLPSMAIDDLKALQEAEEAAEMPRKTLVGALTEEIMARTERAQEVEAMMQLIPDMSDDDLMGEIQAADDEGMLALLNQEAIKRGLITDPNAGAEDESQTQ